MRTVCCGASATDGGGAMSNHKRLPSEKQLIGSFVTLDHSGNSLHHAHQRRNFAPIRNRVGDRVRTLLDPALY